MKTTDDASGRILHDLKQAVEGLRTANAASDQEAARKIRRTIRHLLDEAERRGIDDMFIRRLRAAHPAE